MAQIGQFTRDKSGFTGRIQALTFYRDLSLVPAESSDAETAPDYRVHLGDAEGPEIGAGWKRTGKKAGEIFLMNPTVPDSLDGRYFGPLPVTSIVARAVPLWTDETGDGRFVWRAATD